MNKGTSSSDGPDDLVIIFDENEFVEHLHRRYARVKIDTIMDCIDILKVSGDVRSACDILSYYVHQHLDKCVRSHEEQNEIFIKLMKRHKRRKSRVGL